MQENIQTHQIFVTVCSNDLAAKEKCWHTFVLEFKSWWRYLSCQDPLIWKVSSHVEFHKCEKQSSVQWSPTAQI